MGPRPRAGPAPLRIRAPAGGMYVVPPLGGMRRPVAKSGSSSLRAQRKVAVYSAPQSRGGTTCSRKRMLPRRGVRFRQHQLRPLALEIVIHGVERLAYKVNPQAPRLHQIQRAPLQPRGIRLHPEIAQAKADPRFLLLANEADQLVLL